MPPGSFNPEDPWERVSHLIPLALDPDAPRNDRVEALRALAEMDQGTLRRLAIDAEWREVLVLLVGPADEGREETWSSPPSEERVRQLSASYAQELRRLISDDFQERPAVVRQLPDTSASLEERLHQAAETVELNPTRIGSVEYGRRLAWSTTMVGSGLLMLTGRLPDDGPAVEAFLREILEKAGRLGVPPRLARHITVVLERCPQHRAWALAVLEQLEGLSRKAEVGADTVDYIASTHAEARLLISKAVREAEVLDTEVLAALEIFAMTTLIRTAGARDIARAWGSSGSPQGALAAFNRANDAGHLLCERALRAVMQAPHGGWYQRLGCGDREAVAMTDTVRRKPAGDERAVLLCDSWPSEHRDI